MVFFQQLFGCLPKGIWVKLDISVILGIHVINILWTHMEINGWVNSKVSVTWVFIVYIYYGHKQETNGF